MTLDPLSGQLFPYLLFPLANLLTCISLVYFIARAPDAGKEFRLFAVACITVLVWSASDVCASIIPGTGAAWHSHASVLALLILPVVIHLSRAIQNIQKHPAVPWIAYGATFLVMAASWSSQFPSMGYISAGLVMAGVLYNASCFSSAESQGQEQSYRLSRRFIFAGTTLMLSLLCLQPLLEPVFSPLSLSFIPVILISSGLVILWRTREKNITTRQNLLATFFIALALLPCISSLLFMATHSRWLYQGGMTSWQFHHAVAIFITLVTAATCAFLSFRKKDKRIDALLFCLTCLLVCTVSLREFIAAGLPGSLARQLIPINDLFLVSLIGISIHLVLIVLRKADAWKVSLSYAAGFMLIPVMILEGSLGKSIFAFAPLAGQGLGHFLFISLFMAALALCACMLAREGRAETDHNRRMDIAAVFAGVAVSLVILAGNVVVPGLTFYPMSFVPILLVGYGVFSRDFQRLNTYTRRQIISSGLRLLIAGVYLALAGGVLLVLKDYEPSFIVDRIVPYGIPPMLTFVCAAILSLLVLGMEKNRPESQLFCLISFCYALLNLDIGLLTIVQDPKTALFISRIDHFFLALLLLGVNLHLVYLVIGKKDTWWVVYASYAIGAVMAPLTQTRYYFQGMHTYFWGFFAQKAVLYDLMSGLWGMGLGWGIYLLMRALKDADRGGKEKVKKVLTAFLIIAVLSMGNNPAIYGYPLYPLGTFVFIALIYLAYGLFKFNVRTALQSIRSALFLPGLVLVALGIGYAPVYLLPALGMHVRVLVGLILVSLLYHPVRKGWNAVLDLFIRKSSDVMKDSYYQLTNNLSRIHNREKIHQMLFSWFFEVLEGSCFVSLFSLNDLSGQRIYFGWKTWNTQNEAGLFGDQEMPERGNTPLSIRKDHPLIEICSYERDILTRETLLEMNPSITAFDGNEGLLRDTEMVIPVFSKGVLLAVILVGRKADGSPYARQMLDILRNISLVLGPQIENAVLLEGLEEKVIQRTRELNNALHESMQKEKEIRENNGIITRQNQIFRTLLETSTGIHQLDGLDDLFAFILTQLHTLFTNFQGGIILENKRRGILEATSFIGITEEEQRVILSMRTRITEPDFGKILSSALVREGIHVPADDVWTVFPMEGRSNNRVMGYMIFRGQGIDRLTEEIFTVFLGQLYAVTQNKLLMIQLERMASTDGMTGLYNRAFLSQELKKSIQHSKRFKNIFFSVMVVDVNGLKKLNDTYGHEKGDEAIVKVASLLKTMCRHTDIVSRIGGDEFAILLPSTNYSQAEILYRRIVEGSDTLSVVVSKTGERLNTLPVCISVGLASSDDTPPDEVMKKADALMYEAKERFYASRELVRGA